jgi:hypothetical protein
MEERWFDDAIPAEFRNRYDAGPVTEPSRRPTDGC